MPACEPRMPLPVEALDEAEIEALTWAAGRELELRGGQSGFEALESGWLKLCRASGFDPSVD